MLDVRLTRVSYRNPGERGGSSGWQAIDLPIYLIPILPGAAVWMLTGVAGWELLEIATATLAVVLLQHAIYVLNDVNTTGTSAPTWKNVIPGCVIIMSRPASRPSTGLQAMGSARCWE
jgi:hypothetical protein